MLLAEELTKPVIGLAIEVHQYTGPGLLESVYEQCLSHELRQAGVPFERQATIPVTYKGTRIGDGFRADIIVAREVILEIKAVAAVLPAHETQLHIYLWMSGSLDERPSCRPAAQLQRDQVDRWPAARGHVAAGGATPPTPWPSVAPRFLRVKNRSCPRARCRQGATGAPPHIPSTSIIEYSPGARPVTHSAARTAPVA